MSKRLCAMALCFFAVSPVLADEVLYCVDTAVVGFKWDKGGQASVANFEPSRFTIKIVPSRGDQMQQGIIFTIFTERRIVTGGAGMAPDEMECKPSIGAALVCDNGHGVVPWAFGLNNTSYTRAFLAGPPTGSSDPNIWIAYGTCTKF
jgi:hypothetical protein